MTQKRDLELMYELGCLRFIPRAWKNIFNADFENLAEHHFRVAWIAMLLSKYEGKGDQAKILKMALVHDIPESRTGDVNAIGRQYTKRNEELGIKDMLKDTSFENEMLELWEEYEEKKSIEAKIVKDADWLDVDFEIQEQIARGMVNIKAWLPQRKQVYPKFYTNSARKVWKEIYKSNPHNWFLKARNRFNDGDMKK